MERRGGAYARAEPREAPELGVEGRLRISQRVARDNSVGRGGSARAHAEPREAPELGVDVGGETENTTGIREREVDKGKGAAHVHMQNQVKPQNWA